MNPRYVISTPASLHHIPVRLENISLRWKFRLRRSFPTIASQIGPRRRARISCRPKHYAIRSVPHPRGLPRARGPAPHRAGGDRSHRGQVFRLRRCRRAIADGARGGETTEPRGPARQARQQGRAVRQVDPVRRQRAEVHRAHGGRLRWLLRPVPTEARQAPRRTRGRGRDQGYAAMGKHRQGVQEPSG